MLRYTIRPTWRSYPDELEAVGQLWGMGAPCMATHDAAQDVAPRGLVCCGCSVTSASYFVKLVIRAGYICSPSHHHNEALVELDITIIKTFPMVVVQSQGEDACLDSAMAHQIANLDNCPRHGHCEKEG